MLKPEDINDEWIQQLIADCTPKHPKPKPQPTVEGNVTTLPKPETEAERYRAACEHNKALMRMLREERNAEMNAQYGHFSRQQQIDRCWEASRITQRELDALYASSCHRGPFERF
jgi:hypothetical protein